MKDGNLHDHSALVDAFSDVCKHFAGNIGLLGLTNDPIDSTTLTPHVTDARITDIDAWWWKTRDHAVDYMRDVSSKTSVDAGFVSRNFSSTVGKIINNSALFNAFYTNFMTGDAIMTDAAMQKALYSEHVATYAGDLMTTRGFKDLKAMVEGTGTMSVIPAVIIDRNGRDLKSAFCLSVRVESRDQTPVRRHLYQPEPQMALSRGLICARH